MVQIIHLLDARLVSLLVGTAVQPVAVPLQVAVAPTDDKRQERGRIGERFAAFGVKMGEAGGTLVTYVSY